MTPTAPMVTKTVAAGLKTKTAHMAQKIRANRKKAGWVQRLPVFSTMQPAKYPAGSSTMASKKKFTKEFPAMFAVELSVIPL